MITTNLVLSVANSFLRLCLICEALQAFLLIDFADWSIEEMRRFASKREQHGTVYGKGQELAPAIMAIIRINSSTVKKKG
jgi:hypothetical protein